MEKKGNASLIYYSKRLKQAKEILVAQFGKGKLENYLENLKEFNNVIGEEENKKINIKSLRNGCRTY